MTTKTHKTLFKNRKYLNNSIYQLLGRNKGLFETVDKFKSDRFVFRISIVS